MPSSSTESKLSYLENASQSLLVSSPAICAHLQAERNSYLDEDETVTNASRLRRSCNACGTILIPGWTFKTLRDEPKSRSGRSTPRQQVRKVRCSACGATTVDNRLPRTDRPQITRSRDFSTTPDTSSMIKHIPSETSPALLRPETIPAKASNRRTMSKKSSLQSMLTDQKKADSEKSKGFGMDLKDLMQR